MFITYPTNVDYLIPELRLRVGDMNPESETFSDSVLRTSIVAGIKMLQRRWGIRYIIFTDYMPVEPPPPDVTIPDGYIYGALPQGYGLIPSGLQENDVFRNPYFTFSDPSAAPISQEDEYPIMLSASIILRSSNAASSVDLFQSWSDGEYSFSNLSASKILQSLIDADQAALDTYFKKRLGGPLRGEVRDNC